MSQVSSVSLDRGIALDLKTVTLSTTHPPESRRCALPDGGCRCRLHSGNIRGGRSSPRRSVSPSRTPAWCRSGRCRCHRAPEGSPYVPHSGQEEEEEEYWDVFIYYFEEMPAIKVCQSNESNGPAVLKAVAPILQKYCT